MSPLQTKKKWSFWNEAKWHILSMQCLSGPWNVFLQSRWIYHWLCSLKTRVLKYQRSTLLRHALHKKVFTSFLRSLRCVPAAGGGRNPWPKKITFALINILNSNIQVTIIYCLSKIFTYTITFLLLCYFVFSSKIYLKQDPSV